jgi:hypothetical protein
MSLTKCLSFGNSCHTFAVEAKRVKEEHKASKMDLRSFKRYLTES